jgi:hypothetical protein
MDNGLIRSISATAVCVPPDILDHLATQVEEMSGPSSPSQHPATSSANPTAHFLTLNMEQNGSLSDARLVATLQELFQRMIEEKTLEAV